MLVYAYSLSPLYCHRMHVLQVLCVALDYTEVERGPGKHKVWAKAPAAAAASHAGLLQMSSAFQLERHLEEALSEMYVASCKLKGRSAVSDTHFLSSLTDISRGPLLSVDSAGRKRLVRIGMLDFMNAAAGALNSYCFFLFVSVIQPRH